MSTECFPYRNKRQERSVMALLRILIALYCVWGASGNIFHNETRPQESTQRIVRPLSYQLSVVQ